MLIKTNDIVCRYLAKMYNDSKNDENFPESLKKADITPIYKEKEGTLKKELQTS